MTTAPTDVPSAELTSGWPGMTVCCPHVDADSLEQNVVIAPTAPAQKNSDPTAFVKRDADGRSHLTMFIENVTCPACIQKIEYGLADVPALKEHRLNYSTKRLSTSWEADGFDPREITQTLDGLGYRAIPYDPALLAEADTKRDESLLRAVAVSGFASANIMLLSVSIWAGHATNDMGPATRDLFHWVSALIALPVIAYAGRPFFSSALQALRHGGLNMDVPISLAILLAGGMSTVQTAMSADHAYFDAAVMLLFFLLIGRYLDQSMRTRTRSLATDLLALQATGATVIEPGGLRRSVRACDLRAGDRIAVMPGDSIPADGTIVLGQSDLDTALVSGESTPTAARAGTEVFAGTLNLTGPLEIEVTSAGEDTLLAEMVRLLEQVEGAKTKYTRLADKAARLYAPIVHVIAALTLAGWLAFGAGWLDSLSIATAVLIITCPCALGLAVPAVQVVAASRLMKADVLVKSADGLERLADVDTVVFDKTGTLTEGRPELTNRNDLDHELLSVAAGLAQGSRHPLAKAVFQAASGVEPVGDITEHPGNGLEGVWRGTLVRMGRGGWIGVTQPAQDGCTDLWFQKGDETPVRFTFEDRLKADAAETITALKNLGLRVHMLSGDRPDVTARIAGLLGVDYWIGGASPVEKIQAIEALGADGRNVLMVGDGLNDAPALAAAAVSISPATGADISQTAADMILRGRTLGAIVEALQTARMARATVTQNFALAFGYNVLAVPLAVAGFVTPLIAALAMSGSSLLVTGNALVLNWRRHNS